jgi:hypothetical protein
VGPIANEAFWGDKMEASWNIGPSVQVNCCCQQSRSGLHFAMDGVAQLGRQWTVVLLALALIGCARSTVTDLDSISIQPDGIQSPQQSQLQPEVKPPDLATAANIHAPDGVQTKQQNQQIQPEVISTDRAPVAKIDKSLRMQANREKLIKKLVEMKVIQKTETTNGIPRLWVGTKFRALEPALKEIYVNVYAQYAGDENDPAPVSIYDGKTKTEIGRYSASDGGLKIF